MFGYHVTPTANLPMIRRQGLLPLIGTRSAMAHEAHPGIYLFRCREDADTALMNWLGDCFEDVPLTLLRVTIPYKARLASHDIEYEMIVIDTIAPPHITELEAV